jgi:serine/threonine protein kinase
MVVVGGRYRLDEERGTGGMATVWLVHDLLLDRHAALKLLLPPAAANTGEAKRHGEIRRERLRAEARALASLDHPNVVRVYDLGEHEERDYIVMEYLERGSLADRLQLEGPLPPHEASLLLLQVLDALGAAHRLGIVHRDVKPGNVLVRTDGTMALCDFGIARIVDGPDTQTGVALGSIGYMAPEQRIDARKAGPQADLYAAACTLYNLVTSDTPVDLYLAQDASPRWDMVPQPLRPFLRRATRSEPSARYHDAEEMAEALRLVLPALEGLPAARASRTISPSGGYVPTRSSVEPGSEPSLRAEQSHRAVGVDEWGWAKREHPPVGRPALWVGTTVLLAVTLVGLALGPLQPELVELAPALEAASPRAAPAPAPQPEVLEPPDLEGTWRGSFGGNSGTLVLYPTDPPISWAGEVVLSLGSHELRTRVTGSWRVADQELVLIESSAAEPTIYRARLFPSGLILEGSLQRPGDSLEPLPFALVRQ